MIAGRRQLSDSIKAQAEHIGFDLVGIAPAVTPTGINQFVDWLRSGFAGEMHYMERREAAYHHPRHVLESVRSVVTLGLNYRTVEPESKPEQHGQISRYAWGGEDYHDVLRRMLKKLAEHLHGKSPGCRTRGIVDTAPLLERDFARMSGLGWFGKNTLLINKRKGSWLFLAALLTDLELDYDEPHSASHCGICTRCLDACPTDAFAAPYVLDARRCISYLTIELRDQPIPVELREPMQDWIFGCDVCQDVCPWNTKAPSSVISEFAPAPDANPINAAELLTLDAVDFQSRFSGTPLERTGRAAVLRNAAIVLGNTRDDQFIGVLGASLNDAEPLIRGAAAWALGRISNPASQTALAQRLEVETESVVIVEIQNSLSEWRKRHHAPKD
ncbi:MAG: tRNA epoxyqueuosine(34) reductase QueG [Planctomycetota bacterium]|nr:tRNA epoxyqueuosine(34) reductase QueG [Planctomycetota bacterium]